MRRYRTAALKSGRRPTKAHAASDNGRYGLSRSIGSELGRESAGDALAAADVALHGG